MISSQDFLYKKIVVKVGSNVLINKKGYLNKSALKNIVKQLAYLRYKGVQIILVSSGAVGSGKSILHKHGQISNRIIANQVLASIGQVRLIQNYTELFQKEGLICSQILITKEDFRDRKHYLNLRNCLHESWKQEIIPIINENDAIAINTVSFTDNDELAGLIASMLNAEAVFILTSVDGLFDGDPASPDAKLISKVDPDDDKFFRHILPTKSSFGRGGMITKCQVAKKNSSLGIATYFLNGKQENVLLQIIEHKKQIGTYFLPSKKISSKKKWIANTSGFEKAVITIDEGAEKALKDKEKINSLLPVGIIKIDGEFEKSDILKIVNQENQLIGFGLSQYSSKEMQQILKQKHKKPLIRHEYLFLN
jgi:glutamate 5-kinase